MSDLPFDPRRVSDPRFVLPKLSEATEGWRAWRVAEKLPPYGTPPKLFSINAGLPPGTGYYWTPRRAAMAECDRCPEDDMPQLTCTCGFYSASTLDHLLTMMYHVEGTSYYRPGEIAVVGQVANWGHVIEGSQGWRSQFSYPIKLYVPLEARHLAKPLSNGYGIPVAVMLKSLLAQRQKKARAAQ